MSGGRGRFSCKSPYPAMAARATKEAERLRVENDELRADSLQCGENYKRLMRVNKDLVGQLERGREIIRHEASVLERRACDARAVVESAQRLRVAFERPAPTQSQDPGTVGDIVCKIAYDIEAIKSSGKPIDLHAVAEHVRRTFGGKS